MDDDSLEALVPRLLVAFCRVFVACSLAALAALSLAALVRRYLQRALALRRLTLALSLGALAWTALLEIDRGGLHGRCSAAPPPPTNRRRRAIFSSTKPPPRNLLFNHRVNLLNASTADGSWEDAHLRANVRRTIAQFAGWRTVFDDDDACERRLATDPSLDLYRESGCSSGTASAGGGTRRRGSGRWRYGGARVVGGDGQLEPDGGAAALWRPPRCLSLRPLPARPVVLRRRPLPRQ